MVAIPNFKKGATVIKLTCCSTIDICGKESPWEGIRKVNKTIVVRHVSSLHLAHTPAC
jgi:hypothetical protein